MITATINRHFLLLRSAFEALHVRVPVADLEKLAMLVQHSMDQGRRTYHVSSHVFDVCEGMGPRQVLAGLFHDVVYYQLDGGFPREAQVYLARAISVDSPALAIRPEALSDRGVALCAAVFGFEPGAALPLFGGLNEFLSALVAVHALGPHLPDRDLLAIVAAIEATVPFRGSSADGEGPIERLERRLRAASEGLGLGTDDTELGRVLRDAVGLANRDVAGFAEADPAEFLSASWDLLLESNAPLASPGVYSLQEYRGALTRMHAFLGGLNPDHVFHRYRDTPSADAYEALRLGAQRNLAFSTRYLGAKLVTVGLVEALALATGGDCPVSMFVGDIRARGGKPERVEDHLPPAPHDAPVDAQLLRVLEKGRARESSADMTASPLTAHVYRWLGEEGMTSALELVRRFFAGQIQPEDVLKGLDRELVRSVLRACAHLAVSRVPALRALEAALLP